MARHSMAIGVAALVAAAVVLPAPSQAEHENRYFGFSTGYQPYTYPYTYYPPPRAYYPPRRGYVPPPRVRQSRPGVYEYEVAPGHWVRVRPGYGYQPQRERRVRAPRQQQLQRSPGPPPVPKPKPELAARSDTSAQPDLTARPPSAQQEREARPTPETTSRAQQAPATSAAEPITCEAAADIVRDFGFSDVRSTSCSGQVYGFDADRDGSAYSITISAADGELTEVRRR
jgi:hypothetical protein